VEVVWRVNADPLATNPNATLADDDDVTTSVILNVGMKSMFELSMLELRFRSQVPPLVRTLPWSISNPKKTERLR
jgi:hypothetical protein